VATCDWPKRVRPDRHMGRGKAQRFWRVQINILVQLISNSLVSQRLGPEAHVQRSIPLGVPIFFSFFAQPALCSLPSARPAIAPPGPHPPTHSEPRPTGAPPVLFFIFRVLTSCLCLASAVNRLDLFFSCKINLDLFLDCFRFCFK